MSIIQVKLQNINFISNSKKQGIVRYRFKTHDNAKKIQSEGQIHVTIDNETYQDNIGIICELLALYELLVENPISPLITTGHLLTIIISSGAIKKALSKKQIKTFDHGKTSKVHIANFSHFLATRFFEATYIVDNKESWIVVGEPPLEEIDYNIKTMFPLNNMLESCVGNIIISRHGFNRFIERVTGYDQIRNLNIFFHELPDKVWSSSWNTLKNMLKKAVVPSINDKSFLSFVEKKYGSKACFLLDVDSNTIFVCNDVGSGLTLVTTYKKNRFLKWID